MGCYLNSTIAHRWFASKAASHARAKKMPEERFKTTFIGPAAALLLLFAYCGPLITVQICLLGLLVTLFAGLAIRLWVRRRLRSVKRGQIAFFHPFAENKGGGERVLWCAVKALQEGYPNLKITLYSGPDLTSQQLRERVNKCFNINVANDVDIVPLRNRWLVDPLVYPRLTLIRQAIGSVRLAWEGLLQQVPDVFVDTCGWAFCYPLVWLTGAKVVSYVHYPAVSTDMLMRVWDAQPEYNNREDIASSSIWTFFKLIYYNIFALAYGIVGAFPSVCLVNSSWTLDHVASLWWQLKSPILMYPPVDTVELQMLPLDRPLKELYLISVAQFRPEKNHRLQLEAYKLALTISEESSERVRVAMKSSKLKLVGNCRDSGDEQRLRELKQLVQELGLCANVEFYENIPYSQLKTLLGAAVGGLHTMVDEHFGISIVEYMAAGVIPIAHNSGGPKQDIVLNEQTSSDDAKVGYLASIVEEYAHAISEVLTMSQKNRLRIACAARSRSRLFSQARFTQGFRSSIEHLLPEA